MKKIVESMLNKECVFLFLFFLCSNFASNFLKAEEPPFSTAVEKKYNLSICGLFKNEEFFLKEWIEYHNLIGVDHFYLYNIGSRDSYQRVLQPYIDKGLVTLVNWPEAINYQDGVEPYQWALSTQIPAYENAVNFVAKKETKWLVFVDIDEFLVCPNRNNVAELLEEYEEYPGIYLNSVFYDAAVGGNPSRKKLLIQSIELANAPALVVEKSVAKMIFKPDNCAGFFWPPYQCRFKNAEQAAKVEIQDLRINCYINRNKHLDKDTFIRKAKQKLAVDNRYLNEMETFELLNEGYVIEDQDRPIFKYVPELLEKMEF